MVNNKKILITGGAGFIGANFVYKFLDLGCDVNIIEKQGAKLWRLDKIKDKIKINFVDLKNSDQVEEYILKLKPQIILHFITYGVSQATQQDIKETIDTNLFGTINLVNACEKIKFECFINTGTSSEYGIKEKPIRETDLLEPDNLYGVTKAASTMYCQYMAKKSDLPIVTMRPFAVYGYFEEKERLIPTVIKFCLTKRELRLASPNSVRDFVFIEDVIGAYLAIIENIQEVKGKVFNIGSGIQTTIDETVNIIKKITQSTLEPKYGQVKPVQTEPKNWLADVSKIKKILNWQPRYNLQEGLKKDIEWFKKNISLY